MMPLAKVTAQHHARYAMSDVFLATQAEVEAFGDKLHVLDISTDGLPGGFAATAGAIVLADKYKLTLTDLATIEGTGTKGMITALDVRVAFEAPEMSTAGATASAIELAEAHGLDILTVTGTGKGGRVTLSDVERAVG